MELNKIKVPDFKRLLLDIKGIINEQNKKYEIHIKISFYYFNFNYINLLPI